MITAALVLFAQTVLVLDMGIDPTIVNNVTESVNLAPEGSRYGHGHGTQIGVLINRHCPSCKIVDVRFYNSGVPSMVQAVNALDWVIKWKKKRKNKREAATVSCSFQWYTKPAGFAKRVTRLKELGVPVVVAAGNNGSDVREKNVYPALTKNVITVGALDQDGSRASYSNYGPEVDVWARGSYPVLFADHIYNWHSGTSYATPIVAAIMAGSMKNGR